MSSKKDTATAPLPTAAAEPQDDTVLTFEALQRSQEHIEVNADGVTLWTPDGEHYAWPSLQCDYVDLDYRGMFGLLGGFSGRGPRVVDA